MIGKLIPTKPSDLSTYCPVKWEELEPTENEKVKFCSVCAKKVFFCETLSEVEKCQAKGECISFETYIALIKPPVLRPVKMQQIFGGPSSRVAVELFKQCQKSVPD